MQCTSNITKCRLSIIIYCGVHEEKHRLIHKHLRTNQITSSTAVRIHSFPLLNVFWTIFIAFLHLHPTVWNQILTCLSVRFRSLATSYLRSRERYILNRNSFSSSRVWCLVYGQRFFLVDFACSQLDAGLSARRVGERELVMLRPFYDQRRRKKRL